MQQPKNYVISEEIPQHVESLIQALLWLGIKLVYGKKGKKMSAEDLLNSPGSMSEKVIRYETFLNETLKKDMQNVLDERDKVYADMSEYLQLKNVIEKIQESEATQEPLKTRIDLGCNFYAQANVPDPSRVCVLIGYGFYLEMELPEALKFIEKKTNVLQQQTDQLTNNAAKIKANIRLVLEGLREIQQLDNVPEKKPQRNIFA